MDFRKIDYLKSGNVKQRQVYELLTNYAVFRKLKKYDPILTGTIPIEIDTEASDLDIICCWENRKMFEEDLIKHFNGEKEFRIRQKKINEELSVIANFSLGNFQVEIFGQNIPSKEQMAYRHMIVEHELVNKHGEDFRKKIIALKKQGIKTEPAFTRVLNIPGDPYTELLNF
ncbi:DUF4269 domain-containing protein [Gramella jeungdoensis]|uniref:DUF4269 domain-containing protein n=1 Tax=Gramella jeungdoensis TaxID=708091 RepID=A0ABT0YYQ0_9FLAO|nr:DUF4269 domain-containing protein [Gramella jeungdoensis]MCM8568606.1 DUF4269 domain-containing protein [Gramella jeungdoensis]